MQIQVKSFSHFSYQTQNGEKSDFDRCMVAATRWAGLTVSKTADLMRI